MLKSRSAREGGIPGALKGKRLYWEVDVESSRDFTILYLHRILFSLLPQ